MSTETRQQLIYGDGALQKASLTYKNPQSGKNTTIPVQFNPTEYSIQRSLKYESHTGQGEEAHPDDQQASRSGLAMLNDPGYLHTDAGLSDSKRAVQISERQQRTDLHLSGYFADHEAECRKPRTKYGDIFMGKHGILRTCDLSENQLSDVQSQWYAGEGKAGYGDLR